MLADYLELYAYNRWAHERTLAYVAQLSHEQYERTLGGSFPTLRATMEHMLRAEMAWLARWQGNRRGPAPELTDCTDVAKLAACWEEYWARQSAFLATLGESDLDRPVEITLWSGLEAVEPLRQTLRHVVNHATYHRGQVTTLTRQLGGVPVGTDYFIWVMQRQSAPAG